MAPLKWSAERMAAASQQIRWKLDVQAVTDSAARLKLIMLGEPGLRQPTDAVENRFDDQQRRARMPGDHEVLLGDSVDMAEHVARAVELEHPLQRSHEVRDDLRAAIAFICAKSKRAELAEARAQRLASLQREAAALTEVDRDLSRMRSGPAHRLMVKTRNGRRPSIALWAALVRAMEWPDSTVIDGLLIGFPTVGEYPATGIFREKSRSAENTFEKLDHISHNVRLSRVLAGLARSDSPAAAEALRQSERLTKAEVQKGLMRGPFYEASEVEADIQVSPGS